MKIRKHPIIEARTVALFIGLAIGLGIAVHELFFIIGLIVVLAVAAEWTQQKARGYLRDFRLTYRYP